MGYTTLDVVGRPDSSRPRVGQPILGTQEQQVSKVRVVEYRWHLRQMMASRGLMSTTDLAPLLGERGVHLSPAQTYRLVANRPERLSLHTLSALCDALQCSPSDLIEPVATDRQQSR